MALRRDLTYPNRYSSATQQQPQGAFLNRTTPTSNDGSYPEQQWLNDWSALFSSLLVNAGITPNNAVDAVGDSQYFDALMQLISRPNVLINSDLTFANAINQRGVASWDAVALNDYGLDRWKKVDTSTIIQPVEQGNFIPNETYTLSWNNGADSRVIVAPTSGNWENSDLEIPITATGATKLEVGKSRTAWTPVNNSVDLVDCQRCFNVISSGISWSYASSLSTSRNTYGGSTRGFQFINMRIVPAVSIDVNASLDSVTGSTDTSLVTVISHGKDGIIVGHPVNSQSVPLARDYGYIYLNSITLDAEI